MFNKVYNDYSDDSVKITIKTKEVSAQEAADFYKKHLDEFKSKIVYSGELTVLDVKSKWFVYPDWHTDNYKLYIKFNVNSKEITVDTELCMAVMRYSDMATIKEHLLEKITDKLEKVIRDEILKEGTDLVFNLVQDCKRK
jgi:uncharacterized protein YecA (UPF0149 family)